VTGLGRVSGHGGGDADDRRAAVALIGFGN
jgi:hypothetical protein